MFTHLPPFVRSACWPAVTVAWIAAVEGCEDAVPQDLVLLAASQRWARRALLNLTADNDFRWLELVSRQVDLAAVGQSIPVVVADLGISGEDLAEDQLSAEQVLNDQGSHPALTTGCVAGVPIPHIVRVAGIRSPAGAQYRPQHLQVNRERD